MEFWQVLCIIIVFAIPFLLFLINKPNKPLPPSPKKVPLIGNLGQLAPGLPPHVSFQRLSDQYGPLMLLQLGSTPTLVISSADIAREIFRSHDLIFSGRPSLYAAKRLSYGCRNISFAPYGEFWREMRKIASLHLLSSKRVQSLCPIREEEVAVMVNSITHYSLANGLVDLSKLTLVLSNDVICRVTFGKKHGAGEIDSTGILHETQALLGEMNVIDFFPWFGRLVNKLNGFDSRLEKNFKALDELYDQVIEEHLDSMERVGVNRDHEDIVHVLLRLQKDPTQSITLTNYQIKGVLTDIFIAGSDTASAIIVWTMTELIKNPSVMRKAQNEVRKIAKEKLKVEESDLSQLNYLKSIIKESLRLHPPAPLLVPRETTEDCRVRGYRIPAKTRVFINAKSIAMDPTYGEDPHRFNPERFLNNPIDYKGQDFEFLPFGVGRRGCPGTNFAMLLVELALANLLYCFNWGLPNGMTRDDIDMVEALGITTHKKSPLVLMATPWTKHS